MARFKRILKWTGIVIGSLLGLLILLVVLVGVFAGDGDDSQAKAPTARGTFVPQAERTGVTPGPTATPHPTATRQPTPTLIRVTANTLERQHEANEVSWESKYVDRYVLITGSISSITEAGNQYDVKLATDNLWVDIVCKVGQSNRSSILGLATGEAVTVYGLVTDDGIIDIVVRNCTIRPPQSVSAKEQERTPAASPAPHPTTPANPTPTPNSFAQYQGMTKNAAVITVYIGTPTGSGSGFIYRADESEKFVIVTNYHVVQDHSNVEVCWALIQKCIYEQVKHRGSEYFDVAVLDFSQFLEHGLDTETFRWFASWYGSNITNGESSIISWAKGDVVYAAGYPGGHRVQGTDIISDPVVTEGIIASDRLASYRSKAYFIEHGANIEPGSSGGPLMNNDASIIGINTGTNLIAEQLELAIPMSSVIEWLETGEEPSLTRTPRMLPDVTPGPTSTLVPMPTSRPNPTPQVGAKTNPIPLGSVVGYPDWEVSVRGFMPNANSFIASENQYNDPPDPGYTYILVEVQGLYTGSSVGTMRSDLNYYMVGHTNVIYEVQYGIVYNGLYQHPDVFQGGRASGSLLFMVPSDEIGSLLLIIADGSLRNSDTTVGYFLLE